MKNRIKGFTLIELLLVVAIVGVLGIIITINLTKTLKNTQEKECKEFIQEVEDAACVYSGLKDKDIACNRDTGCEISLEKLVTRGLISSEIDGCTKEEINLSKIVKVTWDDSGEKHCEYVE